MQSLYENLRVYKKSLELVAYFEQTVRGFERYHKYTVGSELRVLSLKILRTIAKANKRERRQEYLTAALDDIEDLKIIVNVCQEIKAFKSFKSFEHVTRLIVDISKQCEGWLRSQNAAGNRPEVGGRSK